MENEKVKYLIDMINDMDLTNKLRLAICMSNSICTNLKYDKTEMYKYFDSLLKEIDIEYRTTLVNFAKYHLIMFAMAKIMEMTKKLSVFCLTYNHVDYIEDALKGFLAQKTNFIFIHFEIKYLSISEILGVR